jgi:hypothetical protein
MIELLFDGIANFTSEAVNLVRGNLEETAAFLGGGVALSWGLTRNVAKNCWNFVTFLNWGKRSKKGLAQAAGVANLPPGVKKTHLKKILNPAPKHPILKSAGSATVTTVTYTAAQILFATVAAGIVGFLIGMLISYRLFYAKGYQDGWNDAVNQIKNLAREIYYLGHQHARMGIDQPPEIITVKQGKKWVLKLDTSRSIPNHSYYLHT